MTSLIARAQLLQVNIQDHHNALDALPDGVEKDAAIATFARIHNRLNSLRVFLESVVGVPPVLEFSQARDGEPENPESGGGNKQHDDDKDGPQN